MTDTYEARGPHLPDVLTRQSPWVYLFVGVTIVHAWLLVLQPELATARLTGVLISLLGAALFVRHPDARRTMLAFGTLIPIVDAPIVQFLDSLSPPSELFAGLSPALVAASTFTTLVAVAGALYLAVGLAAARQRAGTQVDRAIAVWLGAIGIVTVVIGAIPVGVPSSSSEWLLFGIGLVLSLGSTLTWCYVAAVAIGGSLAGEAPRRGWGLAAIGSALQVVVFIITAVGSTFIVPEGLRTPLVVAIAGAIIVGWACLLAAFALGLPAITDDRPGATPPGSAGG